MMDSNFKAAHLLIDELNYELKIRGIITNKDQSSKRKILNRLIDKERSQNIDVLTLKDSDYNFALEETQISNTLDLIQTSVSDFEGSSLDSACKRILSRLAHVTYRIQRIILDSSDPLYSNIVHFKNESYVTTLQLDAELHEKILNTNDTNTLTYTVTPSQNVTNSSNYAHITKPIAVYKLGVQFDGEPKSLLNFIERVEELAEARNISKDNLFQAASDLFTGTATFWFRQIKSQVTDWNSLVNKLKLDFLPSDFDDEIWSQIKNRKQSKTEPVVIFIACMENLFSRLSKEPSQQTKIKFMKLSLQDEYRKRLALNEIDSVATLSNLCKKLEEADILSIPSTSSSMTSLNSFQESKKYNKEKQYVSKNKGPNFKGNKQNFHKQKSTVEQIDSKQINKDTEPIVCWRCKQPNHTFRYCKSKDKGKFCFKCGSPEVTSKTCQKCNPN